ncbi:MAG: DJ-1 family glyoxalase III [Oscillospiraceae bacterium]
MVYVFLADGFEETEALAPVDVLRRGGAEVKTVGVTGEYVKGSHGIVVKPDITINDVLFAEIDMIVLPGGMPGTINLMSDDKVNETIDYCTENDKYVAAICAAPMILGEKGLLDGKCAICFPGFEEHLKGAKLSEDKVVADGKIITAKGAGVAIPFGLKLLETLTSAEKSNEVAGAMQCL